MMQLKQEIKKTRSRICWGYDGTNGCFIDNTYSISIDKTCGFFIDKHNIEIPKYFNYEPRFNGGFSRDNLPRIKDGVYVKVYVTNLDGNEVKEHVGFHYLLTEIRLCSLIL